MFVVEENKLKDLLVEEYNSAVVGHISMHYRPEKTTTVDTHSSSRLMLYG